MIPSLHGALHKGQCGRIAVVGGSSLYCGAPYFAASAALLVGADLAHIFCERGDVAPALRHLSPDLMVHACLPADTAECGGDWEVCFAGQVSRVSVLVVGCGLGRRASTGEAALQMMALARQEGLPVVVDGDGLWMVSQRLEKFLELGPWPWTVFTPNVNEFRYLANAVTLLRGSQDWMKDSEAGPSAEDLSSALGVTILKKGEVDVIAGPEEGQLLFCEEPGSLRRCGGQGDALAGAVGTFLHWAKWCATKESSRCEGTSPGEENTTENSTFWTGLAALGAACVTRAASRLAYQQKKRAMSTTDLMAHLGEAFATLFPDKV